MNFLSDNGKELISVKRKTALIFLALTGFVCILIIARALYSNLATNKNYDLQLGFSQNQEFTKMNDSANKFKNNAQLIAMAIYPDKKDSLLQAQLYVTKRGDSEILQLEKMRETSDLAAFEMRLKNLEWDNGEYTLYFKRGLNIQKSLDFTLH